MLIVIFVLRVEASFYPEVENQDLAKVIVLVQNKKYDEANELLRNIRLRTYDWKNHLKLSKEDSDALFELDRQVSCMKYGTQEDYIKCFKSSFKRVRDESLELLKIIPGNKEEILRVAMLSNAVEDYETSIKYYLIYFDKFQDSVTALDYSTATESFIKVSDYKNARKYVDIALKLDPGNPSYVLKRARIKSLSGDLFGATSDYRKTINDKKCSPETKAYALTIKGETEVMIGNFTEAVKNYESAKDIYLLLNEMSKYKDIVNRVNVIRGYEKAHLPYPLGMIQVFFERKFSK